MNTIFGFGVLLLAALNLNCSSAERDYTGCTTNYSVLEQAVLEIGDNRYNILKAFYPVGSNLPSVYVNITYEAIGNEDIRQTRLWTKSPIYFIIPAEVFQYASLLFIHHSLDGLVTNLAVKLPYECCNGTSNSSLAKCQATCNNKYLDILTNELYLYAQSNGKTTLTLDEISSSSIPVYDKYDKSCNNELFDPAAFYVFHVLCWILPFVFYLFISLIIQSCRPKIRHMLDPPTPGSSNNPSYAAFVLVGLIFSIYVIICDGFAIAWTFAADSELSSLNKYEESAVQTFTKISIIGICSLDIIFSFISLANIVILFCVDCNSCGCRNCCQSCCIFCFFIIYLWRILDCQKRKENYIALTQNSSSPSQTDKNDGDITSETKAWLLMTSFMAPIVCVGTHSGFVLIAWASDPNAAGSMTIFFVLSFLYYFFGFRQLYIVLASRCKESHRDSEGNTCTCCKITCKRYNITEAGEELDRHHENLKHFNFKVLCCMLPLVVLLMCAHGLSIAAYVLLPSSLIAVPSSLLNLLHWAAIIGSGLIAYKLLTLHAPYEEVIAKNLLKAYDSKITSKDYPKELGRICGEALKKYHPPTPAPAPSSS